MCARRTSTTQSMNTAKRRPRWKRVCKDNALAAAIVTDIYPARISIIPDGQQMNLFDAIDENGEIGSVEMIMGARTVVSADMKRAIPADVLKKLIRKAEAVFSTNTCAHSAR